MNVAEQLVAQLVDAGVRRIYGIVGDSLNPVVDAVRKTGGSAKGGIDWVHVRHEEAAAFARTDRGHSWHHMLVSDWEGTLHLCPCPTSDPDSCDFRAVITRGLPPVCTRQARRVRT